MFDNANGPLGIGKVVLFTAAMGESAWFGTSPGFAYFHIFLYTYFEKFMSLPDKYVFCKILSPRTHIYIFYPKLTIFDKFLSTKPTNIELAHLLQTTSPFINTNDFTLDHTLELVAI